MSIIEQVAPGLERILPTDMEVEWLGEGYGGFEPDGRIRGVAEGPVWIHEKGHLLFSDNANNKRYKWAPGEGVTLYKEPTGDANGLARDPQGRIIACEHMTRRVTREELDGTLTVVANNYRSQRLNRPNDVIVRSDGAIYFTDPATLGVEQELDFNGVYRVSPDLGTINLLVRDFALPNGIAFSTDERTLYVNDSMRRHIRAFALDVMFGTGTLNLASDRIFCQMSGDRRGGPDGMKVDVEGNVWCTGPGGIWIIDPSGKHLGTILLEEGASNFCFGGDDWTTIFITTHSKLAKLTGNTKVPGLPTPYKP